LARRSGARHYLSDFQGFILANLKQQARLEAELARMKRFTTASQKLIFAARIDQLRVDLTALRFAMDLRCQQENPESWRIRPRAISEKISAGFERSRQG
jgi:hypothetical protein